MRILIAEDDFTSRIMLESVLRKQGHDVIVTVNGIKALEAMQENNAPQLAILDWKMPEMDGLEVVRKARSQLKSENPPYIIMLTVHSEKDDIITGLQAGANDYLTKPFNLGELGARVEAGRRIIELQAALNAKIEELHQAIEQIKTLRGIVPICASCKKIRDDQGFWNQVETYISEHSEAQFSHGICPDCIKKLYPWYQPPTGADAK